MLHYMDEKGGYRIITHWKDIPREIREQVCTCNLVLRGCQIVYRDQSKGDPSYDWRNNRCDRCRKPNIHVAYTCIGCEKHFLKTFKHPNFCYTHNPMCWSCLQDADESLCGCPGQRPSQIPVEPTELILSRIEIKSFDTSWM